MNSTDFLRNTIFTDLVIREKKILKGNSAVLDFEEEEMLFKKESFSSYIYFIEKGSIKLKNNEHNLFFVLEKDDFLGLDYIFNEEPVYYSAYASRGSRIVQISIHVIRNFVCANSFFQASVSRKNSEINKKLVSSMLDYRARKLHGAFASFLLRHEKNSCPALTRKEIAELLGYSRENITKVVRTFISEGIIEEDQKHLRIVNRNFLETLKKNG